MHVPYQLVHMLTARFIKVDQSPALLSFFWKKKKIRECQVPSPVCVRPYLECQCQQDTAAESPPSSIFAAITNLVVHRQLMVQLRLARFIPRRTTVAINYSKNETIDRAKLEHVFKSLALNYIYKLHLSRIAIPN